MMKYKALITRLATIWLATALVVVSAGAQEVSLRESPSTPSEKDYASGRDEIKNLLQPAATSSPRSTKIRLLTGHLTSIPNQQMANVDVENIGRSPYIRRDFSVTITYDTPPERINRAVEILREILSVPETTTPESIDSTEGLTDTTTEDEAEQRRHPNEAINLPGFPPRVFFNNLNADSLNILVVYWYHPHEYWNYMEHATWINLQIMERFNAEGIDFALPTQTLPVAGDDKGPLTVDRCARADRGEP